MSISLKFLSGTGSSHITLFPMRYNIYLSIPAIPFPRVRVLSLSTITVGVGQKEGKFSIKKRYFLYWYLLGDVRELITFGLLLTNGD